MAGTRRKNDLLGKLADLSEEAMQRLSDAPGADKVLGAVNTLRGSVDDLQKRVRGLEDLEKRLAALERKVDKLSKSGATSSSGTTTRRSTKTTSTKSSGGSTTRKKT
jgi:prophage DNA circulation protein